MSKKKNKKKQQSQNQQALSPDKFIKQRARTLKMGKCYIDDTITTVGEGFVVVTRQRGDNYCVSVYLVDIYCLGVKDSFFNVNMNEEELEEILSRFDKRECSYEEAHNWVYGAIAFAEEAGIKPHKSFNLTQYMLEEDSEDVPLIEYEFGKDGKHLLMGSHQEIRLYLPLLERTLRKGNFDYIMRPSLDDDDYLDDDDDFDDDDDDEGFFLDSYGPDVEYTYQHPEYPKAINLHYPWLHEEMQKPEDAIYLPKELIDKILSLPHDDLRQDLEQIILYHIGLTCEAISNDYDNGGYNGALSNAVMLIAEVGNQTSSLDAVLETMRQSSDFLDYHYCDSAVEILVPTLYKLGQYQLDRLMSYIKEAGLESLAKSYVFPMVVQIALRQPERREEVIEWFRQVLLFAIDHIAETKAFDSELAGLLVCDIVDLCGQELQAELKALFDTNLVDLGCCGSYESVVSDMKEPLSLDRVYPMILDIYERNDNMRRTFADN